MSALLHLPAALLYALTPSPAQDNEPVTRVFTDESGAQRVRLTETLIGFNDPTMSIESMVPSPDGKGYAAMLMASDGIAIVENNVKHRTFEGIAADSMVYSPGGQHFAYVGTLPGKQCVVLDGQVFEYRGISQQGIVFSPDGSRTGWIAMTKKGQVAVIDGQESETYEGVAPFGVLFSPDGLRTAYAATQGGETFVVLDGQRGRSFDKVLDLRFSDPGGLAMYVGQEGEKKEEEKWFAIVDEAVHGPYDELMITNRGNERAPRLEVFFVSQDGLHAAFAARKGEEWFAIKGTEQYGPFKSIASLAISPEGSKLAVMASDDEGWSMLVNGETVFTRVPDSLTFGPKGERMGLVVRRGNQRRALIDGEEGKPFERIEPPGILFSPDGQHHTYVGMRGGERFVVIDGEVSEAFKRIGSTPLGFVPGTSRTIYSARDQGRERLVVDGVSGADYRSYRDVVFSADGSHYAYAAERLENQWVVVVDGVEYGLNGPTSEGRSRPFDLVRGGPVLSPDGSRVAWVGVAGGRWFVIENGQRSEPYEFVMETTLSFSPDGEHLAYAAAREGRKMLVVDGFHVDNEWDGFLMNSEFVWSGPDAFSIRGLHNPRFVLVEVEIL